MFGKGLTLNHTILSLNYPTKKAYRKHCGKRRKCWLPPLTSAEACEKSSQWLLKEICVSTGARKPGNTCVMYRHDYDLSCLSGMKPQYNQPTNWKWFGEYRWPTSHRIIKILEKPYVHDRNCSFSLMLRHWSECHEDILNNFKIRSWEAKHINPLLHIPILGSSNSAAISSFPTMFSKAACCWCVKMSIYGEKG